MLTGAFDGVGAAPGDYYPEPLRPAIDALNERIYDGVNNGVYKAGFATSQAAYDEAVAGVFETLDWLDAQLSRQRYVTGRSEEHTSELQSLMRISYAVFCLKKKKQQQ